ncbi:MAG TPA: hydrogenase maturation protease [Verrucomicrobiae bacterium]
MQFTGTSCLNQVGGGFLASDTATPPAGLIVGLGNSLLRDDGIGVHAVRQLAAHPLAGTLVLEVGTDIFSAVSWLESVPRVLAIDALDGGGPPGTIYRCHSSDIWNEQPLTSLHELSLLSVLEFIPRKRWPDIVVLGVQPDRIEFGLELSPVLRDVLPAVVDAARAIAADWVPPRRCGRVQPLAQLCPATAC